MASWKKRQEFAQKFSLTDSATIHYVKKCLLPELIERQAENKELIKMLAFAKIEPSIEMRNDMTKTLIALRICQLRIAKANHQQEELTA